MLWRCVLLGLIFFLSTVSYYMVTVIFVGDKSSELPCSPSLFFITICSGNRPKNNQQKVHFLISTLSQEKLWNLKLLECGIHIPNAGKYIFNLYLKDNFNLTMTPKILYGLLSCTVKSWREEVKRQRVEKEKSELFSIWGCFFHSLDPTIKKTMVLF